MITLKVDDCIAEAVWKLSQTNELFSIGEIVDYCKGVSRSTVAHRLERYEKLCIISQVGKAATGKAGPPRVQFRLNKEAFEKEIGVVVST